MQVKFCMVCEEKHYGRGLCKKHWRREYAFNNYKRKFGHRCKCGIENCLNITIKKYCIQHRNRIKKHLPLDLAIDCRYIRMKGKSNPNWRGGIAYYPNHSLMKKNRIIILIQNPKCEICGDLATQIHHKDKSKTNHNLNNLMSICSRCHQHIHHLKIKENLWRNHQLTLLPE